MKPLYIVLIIVAVLVLLAFLLTYFCFYLAFYVPRKKNKSTEEYSLPPGEIYEPFRDVMISWMKEVRAMPHEDVSIQSFDGLTLRGKYYEAYPGAAIELMFPGYRGDAERDLCGGVQRCFALGRNALIVDQRAGGESDGHIITFGIKEHLDCHAWVDFMIEHFGSDVKIILTGISMGAATVIMAAGKPLPKNVIGVLADCGYTSPKDIIKKVIRQIHLPATFLYPFVKFAAKLFGGFDLEEFSPIEAIKNCSVPIILFHGETDDYVPCDMSKSNYESCTGTKRLVTVPNAGHGLSYPVSPEKYLNALKEFFGPL